MASLQLIPLPSSKKQKNKKEVDRLVAKRKLLSEAEITVIVDFLMCLCRYNQVLDKQAVTLGCHLMQDFMKNAKGNLDHVI